MTTEDQFNYLVCGVFSIVIYLALAGWLAFWIGLRVRSQTRATVIALSLFMGWIFLPLLIPLIPGSQPPNYYSRFDRRAGFNGYGDGSEWRLLVSPQTFVTKNEAREFPGWKWVQVHFAVFGGLALLIRYNCLKRADQHLGRGRSTLPHFLTSDEAAEPAAASP